jgi:hypothetical protein
MSPITPLNSTQWLVLAAVVLVPDDPMAFLADPAAWPTPGWAYGIVDATSEEKAYDAGIHLFDRGELTNQVPGDALANWYVIPLDAHRRAVLEAVHARRALYALRSATRDD